MITIKELAKELNVSISTVSKALNDNPEISADTVKRIKELAKLRNYKPNKSAVSLKSSKTNTIGVIVPDILNNFFAKLLYGVESAAAANGYNIIICISNESYEKEVESLQLLANGTVDGFLLAVAEETQTLKEDTHFKKIIEEGLPIVMFDRVLDTIDCDKVIINDTESTYSATTHLISEGRKNIMLINHIDELNVGTLRTQGYINAINDSSSYDNKPLVLSIKKGDEAESIILETLKNNTTIDGIISVDNIAGIKSLNAVKSMGLKIPQDISLIAFASDELVEFSSPRLSTITQHAYKIGSKSVELLIDRLKNGTTKNNYKTVTVDYELTFRETTK
ncbi:LacI family DNA-binding transcriptional regulator [Winogradskyella sp. A3E31]|uniref:LacI family DNA-binding transcriptional regulator n=1 Tax=Winogradskyella sp. A3E31 TaxID=3349637 RepID=UPI00398BB635